MSRETHAPLFYPFETGDLEAPGAGNALVLNTRAGAAIPRWTGVSWQLVQGFRPDFLALQRAGHAVSPTVDGADYDLALIYADKHRGQNEAWLAESIRRVKPGHLVVMAGGKTDGISSLRKRLQKSLPLDGHSAKNHGEVFWFRVGHEAARFAGETEAMQAAAPLAGGVFATAPGMFSHDRPDAGSQLLAAHLPTKLKGKAADFCAGWGYLSVALAEQAPDITSIDLFEADHASLDAARRNMATLTPNTPAAFHWLDLASEPVARDYDVVVMNPPFHQGRAAEPGIGHAMIRAASKAMKPGGKLFMVANRGLPYEQALNGAFKHVAELAANQTFRVWLAVR